MKEINTRTLKARGAHASVRKNGKRRALLAVALAIFLGSVGVHFLFRSNAASLSAASRLTGAAGKCWDDQGSQLLHHDKIRLYICNVAGGRQRTVDAASAKIVKHHRKASPTPTPTPSQTPTQTSTPTQTPSPSASPSPSQSSSPTPTPTPSPPSGAVMGFDEAGVSAGIGNNYTPSQWTAIADSGFKLFITDPISWSSECSDGNCDAPVNTCTIDAAAVAQIQDAYNVGMDYAVYTRNPNCLTAAITGLDSALQAHLSFAVLDIETGPSVALTPALVNGVTALGQTPVIYSYQGAWESIMSNTTAYDQYALQDGEVANWNLPFPAPYPAGFPEIGNMPNPYGGWSGTAPEIEQVQANAEVGNVDTAGDGVDIDTVNASWLSSLPHQN